MSGVIKVGGMHWVKDRRDRWISDEDDAALVTEAAMLDEITRLRAAGDALAEALSRHQMACGVNDARALVGAWQEARREQ